MKVRTMNGLCITGIVRRRKLTKANLETASGGALYDDLGYSSNAWNGYGYVGLGYSPPSFEFGYSDANPFYDGRQFEQALDPMTTTPVFDEEFYGPY